MNDVIFLDVFKLSYIASTKADKSNKGKPKDGNLK